MNGILTDNDGDLLISGGSLTIGNCQADVAERILQAYPGEFKEAPALGLYAAAQLNGTPDPFWKGEAKKQLRQQGVELAGISFTESGQIEIKIKWTD